MSQFDLFETGKFTLHSGDATFWRINADQLSAFDLRTLAALYAHHTRGYQEVVGIPRGGLAFANALRAHQQPKAPAQEHRRVLVVDDVLTTGSSMMKMRRELLDAQQIAGGIEVVGVVIFSRSKVVPGWITPIWRLPDSWARQ